jgi:hypothetical protein
MAWQRSLQAAIRSLRKEERTILKNLSSVRDRIAELQSLSRKPAGKRRAAGAASSHGTRKRRLSAAGRAAISRAAKARWAAYRARKGK